MRTTDTEKQIINALLKCRCQPGSFDKKFPQQVDVDNISPRQLYFIYKLGYKYRKQIGNDILETICKNYLDNHIEPVSRRESERKIKSAIKSNNHP